MDDALTVVTLYDAVKGPRLLVTQRIMRGDEVIAQAAVEAACITLDGRPRRPPADMVERLSPLFAKRD